MDRALPWPVSEVEAIEPGEPRCGYSHADHTHDGHMLTCLRRAAHAGASKAVDLHVGKMPDGQYVQFTEVSDVD